MTIEFRTIKGESYELEVNPAATVADVIIMLREQMQSDTVDFELVFNNQKLDKDTLMENVVVDPSEFIVIKPVRKVNRPQTDKAQLNRTNSQSYGGKSRFRLQREQRVTGEDPPNFAEKVAVLMGLGFSRENCEKALRVSFYNPDRASLYLVSGNVPEVAKPEVAKDQPLSNDKEDTQNPNTNLIDGLVKYPSQQAAIEDLIKKTNLDLSTVFQVLKACMEESESEDVKNGIVDSATKNKAEEILLNMVE